MNRRTAFLIMLLPFYFLVEPFFMRARAQGSLVPCKSNVKNLATALRMYAQDNQGHYPQSLQQLLPDNYFKRLPTCPAAATMTFTDYQAATNPDRFSFSCVGDNHSKKYRRPSPNYPRCDSTWGVQEPFHLEN